ncbi:TraR/DksA C4-type zinc finger protein [Halomonas sp. HK25]|uniref:TraR/DksA C4-type zinc finger protein n=1 Tax=Halomonas sp. HK25 TaxID=3394321 RepID=UPI0039FCB09D
MADKADIAAEISEKRLETTLKAIEKAVRKPVTTNECDDCGEPIPAARRRAAPWASTCIECQGIREQQAKHRS